MSKRFLITILTVLVIGLGAGGAIYFAKGYTFNVKNKTIAGTGIITVTSLPDAASVYIDGHLTTATNATISSLNPGEYTVKVAKEGFIPWEKKVKVNAGLVTDLKVTLFPAIPTTYPLTFNGVTGTVLSADGANLAFIVPRIASDTASLKKAGVWVWRMSSNQPIAFARGSEPHQISDSKIIDYSKATLRWSSDSKQVLASLDQNNYLLPADQFSNDPKDITPTLASTLKTWDDDMKTAESVRLMNIRSLTKRTEASNSGIVKWSPDETRLIYGSKPNASPIPNNPNINETGVSLRVYDIETNTDFNLPPAKLHFWLPDSKHIVLVEDNQISIIDFDGTNKAVIYAGNFDGTAVYPWPDSSRLAIVSSFPTPTASVPNLYGINLK